MAQLTVLYGPPADVEEFERYYAVVHSPIAATIPDVERFETARIVGTGDGSPSPYHRVACVTFADLDTAVAALGSPEGQAAAADLANFATGGVTLLLSE